jgi:hypothetical protein
LTGENLTQDQAFEAVKTARDSATVRLVLWCGLLFIAGAASAHDGPPYPIVSNQVLGAYRISLWTDPDTTDDGTAGGQFWVMIDPLAAGGSVSAQVTTRITIRPLDRSGSPQSAAALPVSGDETRRFVALPMDHEGRFAVRLEVESVSGREGVDSEVQASYDLRPSRLLLGVYLLPFLLAGSLWAMLLIRRRRAHARPARPLP